MSESRDDAIGDSLKRMDKPSDEKRSSEEVSTGEGDSKQMPSKKQESGKDGSMRDNSKQMKEQGGQIIDEASKSMHDTFKQAGKPSNEQREEQVIKGAGDSSMGEIQQERAMNILMKMKVEPSPTAKNHKLNPECKRSYLEYCLRPMLEKENNGSMFLKNLFISKGSLRISQHYPIYCLAVGCSSGGMIFLCSTISIFKTYRTTDISFSNYSEMTCKKMDSLLPLLKPNHFLMFIATSKLSNECVKKCVESLDYVKGKVALVFSKEIAPEFEYLLNHLVNRRLEFLFCTSDLLAELDVPLKIGHCVSSLFTNSVQFHKILRHSIESLEVEIDNDFSANLGERASRKRLKPDTCDSLKKLKVACHRSHDSFMVFLDDVKGRCPKLKMLDVKTTFSQDDMVEVMPVLDADEISDHLLAAHEKIRAITEKCRPLVSHLKVSSLLSLYYHSYDEFSCDWIKRANSLDLFKASGHQHSIVQEDGTSFDVCKLTSKFENGFLQLEHSTEVGRFIPE